MESFAAPLAEMTGSAALPVKVSATSKNKKAQIFQCLEKTCKQQFSCTSGTLFNDTRLPILTWFLAIELVMDSKKGLSALQIQRNLGIKSYQTAWHMVHRIREFMEQKGDALPMTGIVEMDETYIYGKSIRRPHKPKYKDMVIALRERGRKPNATDKGKDGRVRFFHVPDGKGATIKDVVDRHVNPSVQRIYTDMASVYDFALDEQMQPKHRAVNHHIEWIVPGTRIHTNTVESSFSLLKRGITGSFHRVSTKHLQRYLNEFEYRFNERHSPKQFEDCVAGMCKTKPLTFKALTSQPDLPF